MLSMKKLFAAIIAQYLRFSYELLKVDCVFHMKKDVAPCRVNVALVSSSLRSCPLLYKRIRDCEEKD